MGIYRSVEDADYLTADLNTVKVKLQLAGFSNNINNTPVDCWQHYTVSSMRLLQQTSHESLARNKLPVGLRTMTAFKGYAVPQNMDLVWGDERFSTLKTARKRSNGTVAFSDGYHHSDQAAPISNGHTGPIRPSQMSPEMESSVPRAPMLRDLKGGGLWHSYDGTTSREPPHANPNCYNNNQRHERMDKLVNGSGGNHCIQNQMLPSMRSPENNNIAGSTREDDTQMWLAKEAMKTRAVSLDMGYQARIWSPGHTPPSSGAGTPTKEKVAFMEVKNSPRSQPQKPKRPSKLQLTNAHQQHPHTNCNGDITAYTPPSTPTSPNCDQTKAATRTPVLETIVESNGSKSLHRSLKRSAKSDSHVLPFRRSNSTPDILDDLSYDSDNDNDDYGFLSYYKFKLSSSYPSASPRFASASSSAMQKAKSPSQAHRILPKKWRKSKLLSGSSRSGACLWKQEVSHCREKKLILNVNKYCWLIVCFTDDSGLFVLTIPELNDPLQSD